MKKERCIQNIFFFYKFSESYINVIFVQETEMHVYRNGGLDPDQIFISKGQTYLTV